MIVIDNGAFGEGIVKAWNHVLCTLVSSIFLDFVEKVGAVAVLAEVYTAIKIHQQAK